MIPCKKFLLILADVTIVVASPSQIVDFPTNEPSCGGHPYNLTTVTDDGSPYIELIADGTEDADEIQQKCKP